MKRLLPWLMLCVSAWAQAHTLSVSHLDIAVPSGGGQVQVELDLAIRDLALSFPLDADRDEQVSWGELEDIQAPLNEWVLDHVALSVGPSTCDLKPSGLAVRHYDDGAYATVRMTADCPSRTGFKVHYGLLFDVDPQHRAIITLRNGPRADTGIASAGRTEVPVGAESSHPFLDFLREGVHHILIGYDHLAFLVSLLLPAALLRRDRAWTPSPHFRTSLGHVLGIVTAFTAAHSITLTLAALGWVTPVSRWVEVAIAASVMMAALNNVFPLVIRRLWLVGFGFGLIHGFGFAGALGELGLPQGARLQALVGFNLGVELGQLVVVALLLPLLFAVRNRPWYRKACLPIASIAIACLAAFWLWVRIRGQ